MAFQSLRSHLILPAAALAALPLALAPPPDAQGGACTREGFAADPPGFGNCTSCHADAAPNSGDGAFAFVGVPSTWSPGGVYRLRATLQDPGQQRWGFRVTIVDRAGASLGTLLPADANTEPCLFNGRSYLRHTGVGSRPGVPNGPVDFEFDWVAPAAGAGTALIYGVGLACNWDNSPAGDFLYTAASAIAESGTPAPALTLVLQPDDTSVKRGAQLAVRTRVVNHEASAQAPFLVSRVRLPSGGLFPPSGWLAGPLQVSLQPTAQIDLDLLHDIPVSAPTLSAEYEAFLGLAPSTLLSADRFAFRVLP